MSESVDRVTEIAGRVAARAETQIDGWHSSVPDDVVCAQSRADVLALLDRLRTAEAESVKTQYHDRIVLEAQRQIHELEAELVTVKLQRSDNLRAIAERDAVIARVRSILATSGTDLNSTNKILDAIDDYRAGEDQ